MDFARKQLQKYGWTEGKGLGKHEDGISAPLKPKIKHSVTGIGYNPASDFTEHWWSALYNKAANSLEVENRNGKTKKIQRKCDGDFEITNSTWKLKKKTKQSDEEYPDFFVKTVVLGSGGAGTTRVKVSDSESEDESDKHVAIKMTDEELFLACGGRTAHKGARHGLRALGKLARIEQQEQSLLHQKKYKGYSHYKLKHSNNDSETVEDLNLHSDVEINTGKKKMKKKRCKNNESYNCNAIVVPETLNEIDQSIYINDELSGQKVKKNTTRGKNKKSKITDVVKIKDCFSNGDDESNIRKSKKYTRKIIDSHATNESMVLNENDELNTRKSEKSKQNINGDLHLHNSVDMIKNDELHSKKSKKLKRIITYDNGKVDINENDELNNSNSNINIINEDGSVVLIEHDKLDSRKSKNSKRNITNEDTTNDSVVFNENVEINTKKSKKLKIKHIELNNTNTDFENVASNLSKKCNKKKRKQ